MTLAAPVKFSSKSALAEFRADPVGFLSRLAALEGSVAEFTLGRRKLTLIEELLAARQRSFKKGPGLRRLRRLLGEGLLTADGDLHLQSRRAVAPAFRAQKIDSYRAVMFDVVPGIVNEWSNGETRDIHSEMSRLTLSVVSRTLFSSETPEPAAVSAGVAGSLQAIYGKLSSCPYRSAALADSTVLLNRALQHVVEACTPSATGDDLLSLISSNESCAVERDDQAMTFLLAGHESVATALAWTWFALSKNPAVRARFEAEIDSVSRADLLQANLPYTSNIIAESLRLYPPAWMMSREAIESVNIGGVEYEPGSILVVAPCVTHRDPRYWDRPEQFNPDRWRQPSADRPKYAYFPFGAGARRCIGEQFALTELTAVLATIGKSWRLEIPPSSPAPTYEPLITLRPAGGMKMMTCSRS